MFMWAFANFFYSLLNGHDFPTTCLQFTGFFIITFGYRAYEIWSLKDRRNKKAIINLFLKDFYSQETRKVNYQNIGHLILRALNFYSLSFFIIIASYYAGLAQVNFGIITSCLTISTVLNCILSFFFYGEKLNIKMVIGIILILVGIVWISLAEGKVLKVENSNSLSDSER